MGRYQPSGETSDPLGLSVGTINLVAARPGHPPVQRRAVLTLFDRRPPEVGLAAQHGPGGPEPVLVVRGFVERVGDPVPLVAADGSTHRGEELAADALAALARLSGADAPVCIAVPAFWSADQFDALRGAVRSKPGLTAGVVAPVLVSDAAAAITALRTGPGLPTSGIVALCDLGGSGTSITLFDAAAEFTPRGRTVRYREFAGERIDQAIVDLLLARLSDAGTADPTSTTAAGSLAELRDECRSAKERLSDQTQTAIPVNLPGRNGDVQLSRTELERLISTPLAGLLDTLTESLARNNVATSSLTAVAVVGGGANIPAVAAQLTARLGAPVVTTGRPDCAAAIGAALLAPQQPLLDSPTSMAAAAWAAGAAGQAATESAADGDQSATFRALAWSQDDSKAYEPVPYTGLDHSSSAYETGTEAPAEFPEPGYPAGLEPLAWYKRPVVLFGLAAALALAATGGLAYTLTGKGEPAGRPTGVTTPAQPPGPSSPPAPAAPATVTVTAPDGNTSLSTVPPAPPPETSAEPTTTVTTTSEPTTTSPSSQSTTTTTQPTTQPTSSAPTTTEVSTTEPTSSAAPPSTTPPPSSTVAPPTTERTLRPRPLFPRGG